MLIQVNFAEVESTEPIQAHVETAVQKAIGHNAEKVTRVEVHLHDDNAAKSGVDKRCVMEARISGMDPLTVDHMGTDLYQAITETAGKLGRAVSKKLEKRDARH